MEEKSIVQAPVLYSNPAYCHIFIEIIMVIVHIKTYLIVYSLYLLIYPLIMTVWCLQHPPHDSVDPEPSGAIL